MLTIRRSRTAPPREFATSPMDSHAHRYGIEDESWFLTVRGALQDLGYRMRILPHSIILEKEQRNPRIFGSARDLLEFAQRQGAAINPSVFVAADLYGEGQPSTLVGRRTHSQFEKPTPDLFPHHAPAPSGGAYNSLEAEVRRLREVAAEAEQQRDLWRMTAHSAQERLAVFETPGATEPGTDKRFDQLKRLLARELHPDLAADADEKRVREVIFKRVWAKIEQLQ